jgi:hypothetical protein
MRQKSVDTMDPSSLAEAKRQIQAPSASLQPTRLVLSISTFLRGNIFNNFLNFRLDARANSVSNRNQVVLSKVPSSVSTASTQDGPSVTEASSGSGEFDTTVGDEVNAGLRQANEEETGEDRPAMMNENYILLDPEVLTDQVR